MNLSLMLTILLLAGPFGSNCLALEYAHSIKMEKMEFHWKVDGKNLAVKMTAKTEGWVGIGFNPEKEMQGGNFIIGYVKGSRISISDDYGNRTTGHVEDENHGGKNSILSYSGSEKQKVTTLEFRIPLDSGDKTDTVIDPKGNTKVLLAYGSRDSFKTGHNEKFILEVNLETGLYQELSN